MEASPSSESLTQKMAEDIEDEQFLEEEGMD